MIRLSALGWHALTAEAHLKTTTAVLGDAQLPGRSPPLAATHCRFFPCDLGIRVSGAAKFCNLPQRSPLGPLPTVGTIAKVLPTFHAKAN